MIPGSQIGPVVVRMQERIDQKGSAAITRPGEGFPGRIFVKTVRHRV